METCRRQLDYERTSPIDYEDVTGRRIVPKERGETERILKIRDVRGKVLNWQENEPCFRFFMDGSRRIFRIADVPINSQYYPVLAGQIGVGICQRDHGRLSAYGDFKTRYVLALPLRLHVNGDKNEDSHRGYFNDLCKKLNENLCKSHSFQLDRILYYESDQGENLEDKAIALIQSYMIEKEKEAVQRLVGDNCLANGVWLLKDGSLEYARLGNEKDDPFGFSKIQNNYRRVIGISKSFNPELARLNNTSASKTIAELPVGFRTPVFKYITDRSPGVYAVWYLRLREAKYGGGPFAGVVKIEKILVTKAEKENGLATELVDNISAWVFNERNPVCYGKDNRWHNHLYPIYLTETFVKSKFLSTDYFINLF